MDKIEKTEKLINEKIKVYFEQHFVNKSPDEFLYEISKDSMITLGRAYTKFHVILTCLAKINENSSYLNTLNSQTKEQIDDTIAGIEEICRCLKEIIESILEGVTS